MSLSLSLRSKPLQSQAFKQRHQCPCCRQLSAQAGLAAIDLSKEYCPFAPNRRLRLKTTPLKQQRGSLPPRAAAERSLTFSGSREARRRSSGWHVVEDIFETKESNQDGRLKPSPTRKDRLWAGKQHRFSQCSFAFCDQLFPEGGGLSERRKATNSGFLRRPANSLSCSALLMG